MLHSRRLWISVITLVVIVGLASGGYAWWMAACEPDARLRQGLAALQDGDLPKAEHVMWFLEAGGHKDHARLLRAHLLFQKAKPQLDANQIKNVEPQLRSCLSLLNKIRDQGGLRVQGAALSGQCLLYLGDYSQAERALLYVIEQ